MDNECERIERLTIADVVRSQTCMCIAEVAVSYCQEALLPGSVPDLEFDRLLIHDQRFDFEVEPNRARLRNIKSVVNKTN